MPFNKTKEFHKEAEILKLLGHSIRLKIVAELCIQECNVMHIWKRFGLSQSATSQHLSLLKNKGVIEGTKVGVEAHYSVRSQFVRRVIEILGEQ